ncbi:hypothetical protein GCM10023257_12940 [Streptomyces hyderabadensis]|uniref:Uncharacterized protein n=1 Tax=Streptomyces hyderabadensis TaxID=598549 RepID=A0ABP9HS59_9ACTN
MPRDGAGPGLSHVSPHTFGQNPTSPRAAGRTGLKQAVRVKWWAMRSPPALVGCLLALGAVIGLGFSLAGEFEDSGSIPGSPAQTALTKMDRHFPSPDTQSAQIVFQAPAGQKVTDPGLGEALASSLAAVGDVNGVTEVGKEDLWVMCGLGDGTASCTGGWAWRLGQGKTELSWITLPTRPPPKKSLTPRPPRPASDQLPPDWPVSGIPARGSPPAGGDRLRAGAAGSRKTST